MGEKRRKSSSYPKRLKQLFSCSLARWKLEGIQLPVGRVGMYGK